MKISLRFAILALLFCSGTALAQVPPVVINPGGGGTSDNGLKITITENSVLTEYKGKKQYGDDVSLPELDKGMRTYFMLERRFGYLPNENTDVLRPQGCEISDVQGEGTAADPWKVVKMLSFLNQTNATFNISVVYTYEAGKPWYRVDYIVSSNERISDGTLYGPYLVHIFHSESTFIHEVNCGLGFADKELLSEDDHYQEIHNPAEPTVTLKGRVGIRKLDGSCIPGSAAGSHFFRAAGGITSYNARNTSARDNKGTTSTLGYKLDDILTANGPDIPAGVAIHKAILLNYSNPGWISHETKSFIVGFDETDDGPADLQDAPFLGPKAISFAQAKIGLSSATPQGLEGMGSHVIDGVGLRVRDAMFYLPQVVNIRVTTAGTPNPAGPGDYTVEYSKLVIPAGIYNDEILPLKNIIIHGDATENADKTMLIEILPNCSPHLDLTGQVISAVYTIVDDDENKVFLEPAATSLAEGGNMQVKVKMTGATRAADVEVDISVSLLTAKTTDFELQFPTTPLKVTIPANGNEATFTFKALSDMIIEDAENLVLTATANFDGEIKTNSTNIEITDVTGTIPDNRLITFNSAPAFEGDNMVVTASLPAGITTEAAITLNIQYDDNDAANTADLADIIYNGSNVFPASLTIPADGSSGSFTLQVLADSYIEPDEFFYFDAADLAGAYTIAGPVQLTLKDKVAAGQKATISFGVMTGPSLWRYDEIYPLELTGTVILPGTPTTPFVINVHVDPSSTAGDNDFDVTQTLSVPFSPYDATTNPNASRGTFKIRLRKDDLLEGLENLKFTFSYNGIPVEQPKPLIIVDEENYTPDNKQVFLVDPAQEDLTEGQEAQVKIRLNPAIVGASFPIDVTIAASGSSVASAPDYTLDPVTTITFAPGEIEKTIKVTAIDDGLTEGDEPLELNLTASVTTLNQDGIPETESSNLTKVINIRDAPNNNITFTPDLTTLHEGGAQVKVTAALALGAAASDITITLDAPSGTGITGGDVELPALPVIIPSGATSVEFYVSAKTDDVLENNEVFQLTGTATGYNITGTTLTITDATSLDNTKKQFVLDVAANPLEEGQSAQLTLKLPGSVTTAEAIDITISSGSATEMLNGEFTLPAPVTVTIPAGGNEVSFAVGTSTDNILELTEKLQIVATGTGLLAGVTADKIVHVTDKTGTIAANTIITVTPSVSSTVNEGGSITYTFSLPSHITTAYPLDINFAQLASAGTDVEPADFNSGIPAIVTIPVNATAPVAAQLTLNAKSDGIIEVQEKLRMQVSLAGFTFNNDVIDLDVIDTDLSTSTIRLSVSPGSIEEGQDATVTATLDNFTSNDDIVVTLLRDGASTTAVSGDHSPLGTITITKNTSSGTATISALSDMVLENDEQLVLTGLSNSFVIDGTALTIKDKTGTAANKTISLVPPAASLEESQSMTVTVKLPDNITAADDIDVQISTGPGTVPGSAEYSITPATVKILKETNAATFVLAAVDDNLVEPDEQLVLQATATVYGHGPQIITAPVLIKDKPGNNTITITADDAQVTEGGATTTIHFKLPAGITAAGDITVQLAAGGTAVDADFASLPSVITIPAVDGYYDLVLKAEKDKILEDLEELTLTATATDYTIQGSVTLKIDDADISDAEIKLVPSLTDIGEGNSMMLTAVLQNGMTTAIPISITLSQDGGTAQTTDYTGLTGITINPADPASGTVGINIPEDEFLEWSETLIIKGQAAGITVTGATINLLDKNTTVLANKTFTLTPDATSMEEGNTITVWLRLPAGQKTEDAITINLTAAAGTTLNAGEYTFPASVEIPAGGDAVSFLLKAEEDDLLEPVEVLKLKASGSVYGTNIADEVSVNVTDKPEDYVITVTADAEVTEGGLAAKIRFSLPPGITSTDNLTINLTRSGTADAVDFASLPASVTITAGATAEEISLNAVKDGLIEPVEKLTLTPSLTNFTFSGTIELDVKDADLADASIILTISPASVQEGEDITVTATLQGSITSALDIDIVLTKAGSQAADEDHSPLGTIRIEAGKTSGLFVISAKTDLLLENDETLVLGGTTGSIPVTGATAVIRDATERSITITPATAGVAENSKAVFTVKLPANVTTTEKITVALSKAAGTTATDGEYILPASVEIPVNGNDVTFEVEALADNILETDELLNILATATVSGEIKTAPAALTITDGTNTAPNTLITVSGDTQVSENGTAAITFTLPAGISTQQPVAITFVPGSATPAVTADDITGGIPVSVTIPASGTSATLSIPIIADAVIEPVEKLFLIPSAAGFTFSNNVMLDVLDQHHSGTITFSSDKPLIREAGETATITVSLPGALVAGSNIQVDIQKGGASVAANTDHSALPSSVIIEAGKHDVVFTITATADLVLEETEALVLEGAAAGYSVAGTTIQVEDATSLDPQYKILKLTPANPDITEGNTGDFTVQLPAGVTSAKAITVQLSKTAGVSTAADTDHTQIPVSITIPANRNNSDDFDISAVPDMIIEPQEKLRVDGTVPTGFTFEGTDIFITDATGQNAANTEIRITIDSTVLHEGSTSKVTFSLPAGITSATDIAVQISTDAALAAGLADISLNPATVVIPKETNKTTVMLEALQDNLQEPAEPLKLTGTAAGYTIIPSNTLTIPGDPAPQLSVTLVRTADAAEPSLGGVFSVQLSAVAPSDVVVNYAIGGSAAADSDYEALTGQAVIRVGETSVNIPVTVKDDEIVEGPEDVVLTLQNATFNFLGAAVNCAVNNTAISMQLADNDQATVIIEKIADAAEPATAGSVKIRFTNPHATTTVPVTILYTVTGTATAGTDYEALPGTAIIPAGSNEVIVPVLPEDDTQLDGTKTVIIRLTSASGALPGITWPLGTPAETSVNVYDNDVVSMEIFGLNQVAEGSVVPVTLKASQAIAADIPVNIQLQHDAARTVVTTVPRSGDMLTVMMPANQTEVTFNITIEENDVNDDNGYVNLVIQPFSGGGQAYGKGASSNTATVVTDNDPLEISFKKDTVRVKEGDNSLTPMPFTLQLSRMSSRPIQVQYDFADAFEGAGADKDPQRAKAGDDYQAAVTSITIPPMQSEADITVPVIGDTRMEADKYFALKLANITVTGGVNAPVPGTPRTAVGVIENDDQDVDLEIRPHKGISPNGDGKNDVWIIENIEKYSRNEVVIVNRWGGTIFKTNNYHNTTNNFSGLANIGSGTGKELPDGSYFYILQVWGSDGKATRYNGYIVIKNGL